MTEQTRPADFDGCHRDCRRKGAHTLRWGGCEHAPRPEPAVSMSKVYRDTDGHNSIGFDSYTVPELAELIEPALRTIKIRLGPNALAMLERGEEVRLSVGEYVSMALAAADAIVHRNDQPAPDSTAPSRTVCPHGADTSRCACLACDAEQADVSAPAATEATNTETECCGAEAPPEITGPDGRVWLSGDCWCTLKPHTEGDHRCQPCAERHGAPDWPGDPAGKHVLAFGEPVELGEQSARTTPNNSPTSENTPNNAAEELTP